MINKTSQSDNKVEITWKDVAIIITIYEAELDAGNISKYEKVNAPSLKEASKIILNKFNKLKNG